LTTCSSEALNYVFIQTCKAHRSRTAELLERVDVHVGQELILVELWQADGMTITQLAERLEVQPPTVSRMVRRMERTGLVERRASADDQRVAIVHATDKGRSVRQAIEEAWATMEAEMTAGMTGAETAAFHAMLARVRVNLKGGRDGGHSRG
jgi:DNA-binding MarR family transcriptional regulator